jgi:hypothetical protein
MCCVDDDEVGLRSRTIGLGCEIKLEVI